MSKRRRDQGPNLFDWGAAQDEVCTNPVQSAAPEEPCNVARETVGAANKSEPIDLHAAQASGPEPVIDFRERRETLPRFILHPMRDLDCMDRWIDRKAGRIPPAPIISFGRRARPPDTGPDSGAPERRTG